MRVSRFCVTVLTLLLFTAVPAKARECFDEYGVIGNMNSRYASKKRLSFIFNNEKRKFGEPFHLKYAEFPGQLFPVRFERISGQDAGLRLKLKELKLASRPNTKDEHEVGELVLRHFVGKTKSARYTSKNLKEITAEVQMKAADEKDLFGNILAITHVTDIHTHPNLGGNTDLFFSVADMNSYMGLKKQIESQIERPVHFRAILIPNCADCDDVVLIMDL
jgi:hypothetical protein